MRLLHSSLVRLLVSLEMSISSHKELTDGNREESKTFTDINTLFSSDTFLLRDYFLVPSRHGSMPRRWPLTNIYFFYFNLLRTVIIFPNVISQN